MSEDFFRPPFLDQWVKTFGDSKTGTFFSFKLEFLHFLNKSPDRREFKVSKLDFLVWGVAFFTFPPKAVFSISEGSRSQPFSGGYRVTGGLPRGTFPRFSQDFLEILSGAE